MLAILALLLTIACSLDDETATENTPKTNVVVTDTIDETTNGETDSSDGESDKSTTGNSPTTVKFAKGKTSQTYKKTITGGETHAYYLTASAGQTMSIGINSSRDDAGFTVYNPAGEEISAAEETTEVRDFSDELEDSGRYRIVVSSPRNLTYEISFEVSAKATELTPDEAAGGANKTVRFGKGRSSASYSNSVIRGDRDTYNLKAGAGQFMTVSITSVEDNASFQILAPNGKDLVLDDTDWTGELPRDGNYKIIVGSGRGNATYTIRFSVAQSPIDH